MVTTTLQSGSVAGSVSVVASTTPTPGTTVTTVGRVVIVEGLPDSYHFSLAANQFNIPGYSYDGESTTITASVADRVGNPVANAPVYFTSSAGSVYGYGVTTITGGIAQTSVNHESQDPRPSSTAGYFASVLAWTPGKETFADNNANGVYNIGEPFEDIGEPYIDTNGNGVYDTATVVAEEERYVDINKNGKYDGPNGVWNSDTFVWEPIKILWSYATPSIIALTFKAGAGCHGFKVPANSTCECIVEVTDANGNPVIGGSTLTTPEITITNSGTLGSSSTQTIPDATAPGPGATEFTFNITNKSSAESVAQTGVMTLKVQEIGGSASFTKTKAFP